MKLRAAIGEFAWAIAARRTIALGAYVLGASFVGALAHADTFVVDTTADDVDVFPGDGVCLSGGGTCTLRAAVMEANAFAGADVIDLTGISNPADPITLTLDGVDETFTATSSGDAPCTVDIEADASIGDLDITEFAPLSVKSEGDFADILAEENPGVWQSDRPARGGDAGKMLARIIERAAQMKAEREAKARSTKAKPAGRRTTATTRAKKAGTKKKSS